MKIKKFEKGFCLGYLIATLFWGVVFICILNDINKKASKAMIYINEIVENRQ